MRRDAGRHCQRICLGTCANAQPARLRCRHVHVNVVPMTSAAILPNRTVRVYNGRIAAIAGAKDDGRGCASVVDGRGKYLLPGLNDLHVHLPTEAFAQAFGAKPKPVDFPAAFAPYLAAGVTGVRVMSGAPDILRFRDAHRTPESPTPRLLVATPMLSGAPPVIPEPLTKVVTTPEDARRSVAAFAAAGYDFIKVRDNLKPPVLMAIVDEARRSGLYVDGHLSQRQGLSAIDVLGGGQKGVAHLDNLAMAMKSDADIPVLTKAMLACQCFVSTTLQVETNAIRQITDYDRMIARKGVSYIDPMLVKAFWAKPNNGYLASKVDPKIFAGLRDRNAALLRAFVAAGVHVVAGTDALNPMILPGESLHDELADMVAAGLTPYQALGTATVNPSRYIKGFGDLGVVAQGATANLVLAAANPLEGLGTLRSPVGVMVNGHWLSAATLAIGLDRAAAVAGGK